MGNLLCEDSPSAGLMHALGGAIPNKFPDDADAAGLWIILWAARIENFWPLNPIHSSILAKSQQPGQIKCGTVWSPKGGKGYCDVLKDLP